VSYSAGRWGGTRAAHSLRPILSELGCLPVSSMVHIPQAEKVLDSKGKVIISTKENEEEESLTTKQKEETRLWHKYVYRTLDQLIWWGEAARYQTERVDPYEKSPAFKIDPSERNAPSS